VTNQWEDSFKKGSTHVLTELIASTIKAEYYSAMGMRLRDDFVQMILVVGVGW
jgi:hypothetical protein